jgi:small-conductance mechanosensitive channel
MGRSVARFVVLCKRLALLVPALVLLATIGNATAATEPAAAPSVQQSAAVTVDGRELFTVIGVPAYPARVRAQRIAERILAIAEDPRFSIEQLRTEEEKDQTWILAGDERLLAITDSDAGQQGLARAQYVTVATGAIGIAVAQYREERTAAYLQKGAAVAAGLLALLALLLWSTRWLLRRVLAAVQRRFRSSLEALEARSSGMVDAERFETMLLGSIRALWWLLAAVAVFASMEAILEIFPWTRVVGRWLFDLVLGPLQTMLDAARRSLPNLAFLAILYVVVRYVLRFLELFFTALGRGALRLGTFAPEWAMPTYKVARVGVVAFALVVAYPYIPGSSTDAFKAISVFLGVLVSLGSTSILANVIAGYTLLYRRSFNPGDYVKIGQFTGAIRSVESQVTRLCTLQNEEVVIPNSLILNGEVVNYSKHARAGRLALHSTVTIGYDAPWRQVEAMLIEAARRTDGLLQEPTPFVHKRELQDFFVQYEINVYCNDASRMPRLYSELHANILDVFNEHGVQIMSPHFVGQPDAPVVVPKARWYEAPARRPAQTSPRDQ